MIANTLITSSKKDTAKFNYNLRVVETRLGARLLARHLNVPLPPRGEVQLTYKTVLDKYFTTLAPTPGPQHIEGDLPAHTAGVLPTVPALPSSPLAPGDEKTMHELKVLLGAAGAALGGPGMEAGEGWDDICAKLNEDRAAIEAEVVGDQEVEPVGGKLKLWKRARHVVSFLSLLGDFGRSADWFRGAAFGGGARLPFQGSHPSRRGRVRGSPQGPRNVDERVAGKLPGRLRVQLPRD